MSHLSLCSPNQLKEVPGLSDTEDTGYMTPDAWAEHVSEQEIVVAMRFSYWGKSGWKSPASQDKTLLFDTDRLLLRLSLLQSLALPSLAAQTDQRFHLHVLTSWGLPVWAKQALREACEEVLSEGQFTIDPRRWSLAASQYRNYLRDRYGTARILQVVLDDDDGLSTDFLANMRQEMAMMAAPETAQAVRFISQSRGYGLDLTNLDTSAITLYPMRSAFINLGLALSAQADGMNIYGIAHRATPPQHPHVVCKARRMFVRTIHSRNDSRVAVNTGWKPVPNWREKPDIVARFPWLFRL